MKTDFDILIVGGGLVGASLACALCDSRLTVGMIEAATPPLSEQPSFDDRTLALAYGSRRIFDGLGVWSSIAQRGAAPIKRIHISDRGRFGATRLRARDAGIDALGYGVSAPVLGTSLYRAILGRANLEVISSANVRSVEVGDETGPPRKNCARVWLLPQTARIPRFAKLPVLRRAASTMVRPRS